MRFGRGVSQLTQRLLLFFAFFIDLEQHQTANAEKIAARVANLFSLGNPSSNTIDRLVRVIFRECTAPPFEETRQIASNLDVLLPGGFTIAVKAGEQPLKCCLG